jgi:hypothetical protein
MVFCAIRQPARLTRMSGCDLKRAELPAKKRLKLGQHPQRLALQDWAAWQTCATFLAATSAG